VEIYQNKSLSYFCIRPPRQIRREGVRQNQCQRPRRENNGAIKSGGRARQNANRWQAKKKQAKTTRQQKKEQARGSAGYAVKMNKGVHVMVGVGLTHIGRRN